MLILRSENSMGELQDNELLETYCKYLMSLFYKETNITPINVAIEFVDDLYQRRLELATSEEDLNNVKKSKNIISGFNGTMVLPYKKSELPHILIAKNTISNNFAFMGTLIHELTHIYDFYDFVKENNIDLYEDVERHSSFSTFYQWSEYHARRTGYYYYRKFYYTLVAEEPEINEQVTYIRDTECTFQLNYLIESLRKTENNSTLFLYSIMQFLGRFSVWEDLYPNTFNVNSLPQIIIDDFEDRIVDLYKFLKQHSSFAVIKDQLGNLDKLLKRFILV